MTPSVMTSCGLLSLRHYCSGGTRRIFEIRAPSESGGWSVGKNTGNTAENRRFNVDSEFGMASATSDACTFVGVGDRCHSGVLHLCARFSTNGLSKVLGAVLMKFAFRVSTRSRSMLRLGSTVSFRNLKSDSPGFWRRPLRIRLFSFVRF